MRQQLRTLLTAGTACAESWSELWMHQWTWQRRSPIWRGRLRHRGGSIVVVASINLLPTLCQRQECSCNSCRALKPMYLLLQHRKFRQAYPNNWTVEYKLRNSWDIGEQQWVTFTWCNNYRRIPPAAPPAALLTEDILSKSCLLHGAPLGKCKRPPKVQKDPFIRPLYLGR